MNRLDKVLVEQRLVPTRAKAQELIKSGNIKLDGKIITKASLEVDDNATLEIIDNSTLKYVSRAGLKLEKAINTFNINLNGKKIMDIGSSTGGFTDCSLRNGAKSIIAVDVGTDLMHESLRNHPKVELHEQTNVKDLPNEKFSDIDYITIDVSFVSLSKIIDKIAIANCNADIIALIKPQFECGKAIADKFKGIILNQKIHNDILNNTISMFNDFGYTLLDLTHSPITGGDGNIEYISHFTRSATTPKSINIKQIISSAFDAHKK
jgi:23S rRNA (cytidine1920-2'-O)/16S rRNA (cytidine1409-2'-O)-methyltransferase